jgi:Zn-dependent protease with chaperone function
MTEDKWRSLVARLEVAAAEDPSGYARRVKLLGRLGYFVIGGVLSLLVVLTGLVIYSMATGYPGAFKALFLIGGLAVIILNSLTVPIESPQGLALRQEDWPDLFGMVEEVRTRVGGPHVDHLLVTGEFNAMVAEVPHIGPVDHATYLVVGLPYMQALTPDEFRSVIAHELGHLSASHGRVGASIYRVKAIWTQLLAALEKKNAWTTAFFRRFFEWYVPYFAAYSFPLLRRHEYEADAAAAEIGGADAAARALAVAAVTGAYVRREFWPGVWARADQEAEPMSSAFGPLGEAVGNARDQDRVWRWLDVELARAPAPHDTHPSLGQRLDRLGVNIDELVGRIRGNGDGPAFEAAATVYLGAKEPDLVAALDRAWRNSIAGEWHERHEEAAYARTRIAELDQQERMGALTSDDVRELAHLSAFYRSAEKAAPLLWRLADRAPDDVIVSFALGKVLLAQGDERGLKILEQAVQIDPDMFLAVCDLAFDFLAGHHRVDEAENYRQRADARGRLLRAANAERMEILLRGPLLPPARPRDRIEAMRLHLPRARKLRSAWFVRAGTADGVEAPVHAIVLQRRWLFRRRKLVAEVEKHLNFPGWTVCPTRRERNRLALDRIPGAKIFEAA